MQNGANSIVKLRLSSAQILTSIELLDRAQDVIAGVAKRRHPRLQLRLPDPLEMICQLPDRTAAYEIAPRNLSARGLGGLIGGFLHADTLCGLTLPTTDGEKLQVSGTVRWCRHVSKSVHEIGINLVESIDVECFLDENSLANAAKADKPLSEFHLFMEKYATRLATLAHDQASPEELQKAIKEIDRLMVRTVQEQTEWVE